MKYKQAKIVGIVLKYLICAAIAASMQMLVLTRYDDISLLPDIERYKILCDSFTIPGVLFIMFGVLVWISTTGFFDGLSYALQHVFRSLFFRGGQTQEKYFEYKEKRRTKRVKGYSCLFYTGLAFTLVALYFLMRFYKLY